MKILKKVRLECVTGKHFKQYSIWIEREDTPNGDRYSVRFHYGRIGLTPLVGTKVYALLYESAALAAMNSLISEKLAKGYEKVDWVDVPGVHGKDGGKNPLLKLKMEDVFVDKTPAPKKKPKKDEGDKEPPRRNLII